MREQLKLYCAISRTGDGMLTDDVLNGLLNNGLNRISTDHDWPYLLTSATVAVDTTGSGPLPSGFARARDVVANGARAMQATFRELLDPTGRSNSFVWTIVGSTLRLDPAPTATLNVTLWYFQQEPLLADDTDTPLMPSDDHPAIVYFAAQLAWLSRGDQQRAQTWYAQYEQAMKGMQDELYQTYGPRSVVVRRRDPTWASWS